MAMPKKSFEDVIDLLKKTLYESEMYILSLSSGITDMTEDEKRDCFGETSLSAIFKLPLNTIKRNVDDWSIEHIGRACELGFFQFKAES